MKKLSVLLLFFSLFSCCEDDDITPQPPSCEEIPCAVEDEFFGKVIMNGECWTADWVRLHGNGDTKFIDLGKNEVNGIREGLYITLNDNVNLQDTLWIGFTNAGNPASDVAVFYYGYFEFHSSVGEFDFPFGLELTYEDYLLIDYFNADTSIIEGRFQVHFPNRSVNSFVNAPDSMRLECGSFRVKRE